jgi:hypothetical protein
MAINFPDTPNTGDSYTANGKTWTYNGTSWIGTGGGMSSSNADTLNNQPGSYYTQKAADDAVAMAIALG